jgi:hypothetical protein
VQTAKSVLAKPVFHLLSGDEEGSQLLPLVGLPLRLVVGLLLAAEGRRVGQQVLNVGGTAVGLSKMEGGGVEIHKFY